jgi:hypothetical protein
LPIAVGRPGHVAFDLTGWCMCFARILASPRDGFAIAMLSYSIRTGESRDNCATRLAAGRFR